MVNIKPGAFCFGFFSYKSGGTYMNLVKIFSILTIALIFTAGCNSLPPLPSEEDVGPANISLDNLQKRMKQATDPKGTFRNASSYLMKQRLITNVDGEKDLYVIITRFQKPNKLSITKLENGSLVNGQIINNKRAWMIDYQEKKVSPVEGKVLKSFLLLFDIGNPSMTLSEIFKNIKLQSCRLGDKRFYKLTCSTDDKDIPPISIYVGESNFLVKRITFTRKADGMQYISSIDQYNLYEGVMVSKKMTVRMNNVMQSYETTTYKLNPKLNTEDFIPPKFEKP